ncbi:MAG: winged helix-turn-helix transcriptional regulator [Candidatus Heimdallarchaeota archaeon]|nr:winged helix-turn-helix transcriptional regulator [Candidatus Heimdallarchaeota archaeon]
MPRSNKINISQLMKSAPTRYSESEYLKLSLDDFEKLLPKTIPIIVKEDIVYYFNYLRNNRNKQSLKLWETTSGCIDSPSSFKNEGYRPIFAFLYYDRITNGLFLPLLLNRIEPSQEEETLSEISIEEFNRQCRFSILNFKPHIDSIDLKILHELTENPELVANDLAEKTGHTYVTVYQHLQALKEKLGLRVLARINWERLGIQRIFIITNKKENFKELEGFKSFLDGQATFNWGYPYYLQHYFVNESAKNDLKQKALEISEKTKYNMTFLTLTKSPNLTINFKYYNPSLQKWVIDFLIEYRYLLKSEKTSKSNFLFPEKNTSISSTFKLTPLEIKIMSELVGNYSLTQKEIAQTLGMQAQNLSAIKIKLFNEGIIQPMLEIRNFQSLSCVLLCTLMNQQNMDILVTLLQKLPFSNISITKDESDPTKIKLICFLFLDEILYNNLIVFLMKLLDEKKIDSYRLGLNIDSYFGMTNIMNILSNMQ